MKKRLWTLLGLLPAALMAQNKQFSITGKITGYENCGVLLTWYNLSDGAVKDTVFVTDNSFRFAGNVRRERQMAQVIVYGLTDKSTLFYLEPGSIELNYSKDKDRFIMAGTPLNQELQNYNAKINGLIDSINATRAEGKKVTFFSPDIQDLKLNVTKKYIQQHPNSYVVLDQLNTYGALVKDTAALEAVFNLLSPALRQSEKGLELAARLKGIRATSIGSMAPAFSLPDTQGKQVALADFKGKYVLIDFWATWCMPCMAEMPNVKSAYDQFKGKNFDILGVSLDKPDAREKWMSVIERNKLAWTQVSDLKFWESKVVSLYNLGSIPMNYLIDPQGKIIAKNLRGKALTDKLKEIFN